MSLGDKLERKLPIIPLILTKFISTYVEIVGFVAFDSDEEGFLKGKASGTVSKDELVYLFQLAY